MEEFVKPLIIKSIFSDERISSLEKLILIHIIALCNKQGYCWATNAYFMKHHKCSKPTISKCIKDLASYNYINLKYDNTNVNNSKRIITLSPVLKNKISSIQYNLNTGVKPSFKQYNKNKINNIDKIYYKDESGNEYWHGKLIESAEATEEEMQELENLLKEFK